MGHTGTCQGTRMLELLSHAVDDGTKGNDCDVSYSIATTAFEKEDMKVED